jgi:hypothetical protein
MRLPSLERLASGLRQAPHEYRPSLQVFPDVSIDAVARELNVAERGKENGKLDLPPSSSANFDETEYAILERIFAEQKAAHHALVDQLETYAQRLSALDFHGRFTVIQHAAPAAVSEFNAEAQQGRDELHQLRRALVENERERNLFQDKNGLQRAPRVPTTATQVLKITVLVFLFMTETYINAVFLAKGNELGFIGGVSEALVFAVLNVLVSFAIGLGGIRQLNCRGAFRKLIGAFSLIAWLAFVVVLNLALAHYREVSGALINDAGAKVISRLWQSPAGLEDIKSWLFVGIGLVWSVFALIDGIFFTDPFPGYAALEVRVRKAHKDYIDRKNWLIDQLRDIRDDATVQMDEAQTDLGKRRSTHTAILQGRARILQLFTQHQEQLERAGNAVLSKYRTANRQARSSPPPGRFDEHWTMQRLLVETQLPEILLRKDLDQEIKKAEELLKREIRAIHLAFDAAVESYRQIDDLIPEEPYGAAAKKSA